MEHGNSIFFRGRDVTTGKIDFLIFFKNFFFVLILRSTGRDFVIAKSLGTAPGDSVFVGSLLVKEIKRAGSGLCAALAAFSTQIFHLWRVMLLNFIADSTERAWAAFSI